MLNLSFNLKDPQTGTETADIKETPVICVIRYNNQRLKWYTGKKIYPKHWETKKDSKNYQRAKRSLDGYASFNARLEKIAETIETVFDDYRNKNSNAFPTTNTLKTLLDKEFNGTTETAKTFIGFFQEIIDLSKSGVRLNPKTGIPISPNTIKTYITTLRHLKAYQDARKKTVDFNGIDLDFHNDYTEFLINGYWQHPKKRKLVPLNLSTNARAKDFQIIIMVMNEATDRGLNTNLAYKSRRFAVIREDADTIYLTEQEIKELEEFDLSGRKKLDTARTVFLTLYYCGQRISDYEKIRNAQLTVDADGDEFIEIKQTKTTNGVQIPVHPNLKTLIEKYGGRLPKSYSPQKVNDYLREIGKQLPCLQQEISIALPTQGNTKVYATCSKYEELSSHTARRSYATNEYLAGVPTHTIMAITGHKSEKAFLRYLRLTQKEHAKVSHMARKKRSALLKAV